MLQLDILGGSTNCHESHGEGRIENKRGDLGRCLCPTMQEVWGEVRFFLIQQDGDGVLARRASSSLGFGGNEE